MKQILVLSANPHNTVRLRVEAEARDIKNGLRQSSLRDQFEVVYEGAVRLQELRRRIVQAKPQIVHFSGHGGGEHGLVLEDDNGKAYFVQTEQLAEMFRLFAKKNLECVILNACYSQVQAKAINQFVPYVIGMNEAIGDRAAIQFAIAFYETLGEGEAFDYAFEMAKAVLIGLEEEQKPVLLVNENAVKQEQANQEAAKDNIEPFDMRQKQHEEGHVPNITQIAGKGSKQIGFIGHAGNINL
ncbi:CHAT domain-containing protein [Leptolyngbya sp. CCNP1308]|nr:CHAT domain-containing protein [Leptolyngbya sp. CCNP1308]